MKSGIYKITNNVNGKFYVGSAKNIDKRWYDHKRGLNLNIHVNPKLQHSWNFHGFDKFSFDVIEDVEPNPVKLLEREQYYLDTLKPYDRNVGYNIGLTAKGGDNITNHPNRDAFVEKMKLVNGGENNGMYGKTHSDESIEKQKDRAIGRFTLEWFIDRYGKREGKKRYNLRRASLSARPSKCCSHPNLTKGISRVPMSDEAKQKISDTKEKMKTKKKFLIQDIREDKYTSKQLCEKYNIGLTAVKYHKRKIRNEIKG